MIKRFAKELTSFRQGAQIGESSSRALETPTHGINTFIKRIDKEGIGLGPGTHIWKFSSRAIEAPRHKLNMCTKRSHQKCDRFWTRSSGWEI